MSNYVICTTQRSGKTWLVRALRALGAGHAPEYITAFNRNDEKLKAAWVSGGLDGIISVVQSEQVPKYAGISIPRNELERMARFTEMTPEALLDAIQVRLDAKIIYLKRNDLVAQAVSHYLLRETGYGHSFQDKRDIIRRDEVPYNGDAIAKFVRFSMEDYAQWEKMLRGSEYHGVTYERLMDNPVLEIRQILSVIDFDATITDSQIETALGATSKIADRKNESLVSAFWADPAQRDNLRRFGLSRHLRSPA